MKIVASFEIHQQILHSLQFEGEEKHAWERVSKDWGNPEYVDEILHRYRNDVLCTRWKYQSHGK